MNGSSIDPKILDYYQQMMFPGSTVEQPETAPEPSGTTVLDFLKKLSPVSITETPESTTISPGPGAKTAQSIAAYPMWQTLRAQEALRNAIKDIVSRISLTQEGINLKKPTPPKSSAVFPIDEGTETIPQVASTKPISKG